MGDSISCGQVLCEDKGRGICFCRFQLVMTARIAITQYIFRRQVAYIITISLHFISYTLGRLSSDPNLKFFTLKNEITL